jgi:hypothetical protein
VPFSVVVMLESQVVLPLVIGSGSGLDDGKPEVIVV